MPVGYTAVPCALRTSVAEAGKEFRQLEFEEERIQGWKREGKDRASFKRQIYLPPNMSLNQGICVGCRAVPEHLSPSENI